MSNSTPQSEAAGDLAYTAAHIQDRFLGLSLPNLEQAMTTFLGNLGQPGQEPANVKSEFGQVRGSLNEYFNTSEKASSNQIAQIAKQSGMTFSPSAVSAAQQGAKYGLENQRATSLNNLGYQEATAGLDYTNQLLGQLGNTEKMLQSGIFGSGQNALGYLSNISGTNPWQSALGGAASGASIGGSTGNPYAAGIGAIAGGIYGYASSGG